MKKTNEYKRNILADRVIAILGVMLMPASFIHATAADNT
jgi:hypothetical protein